MIVELFPASSPIPEFQIHIHFMKRAKMCFPNRSRGVYPLKQGHMKQLPLSVNKWFYPPTPTPPPPHPLLCHRNLCKNFQQKYFSCCILLVDRISLSDCLYFLTSWALKQCLKMFKKLQNRYLKLLKISNI